MNGDRPQRPQRAATEAFHHQLVERAVAAMERRFPEDTLHLDAIAHAATSSPYHLSRIFRRISGVPPRHFLTAVRMQAAKRLLLQTTMSITEICLDVGFNSLGTFTTRFTELVGVSPRVYRKLALRQHKPAPPARGDGRRAAIGSVDGEVSGPGDGPVAIGLFPSALPQGRPLACTLISARGAYHIGPVPAGRYYVLAVGLESGGSFLHEPELRGASAQAAIVSREHPHARADVALRPRLATDPPIVVSVPLLFAESESARRGPAAG